MTDSHETLDSLILGLDTDSAELLGNAGQESRGRGKCKKPLEAWVERDLTRDEIIRVDAVSLGIKSAPTLQNIRDSHRRIAQLMSSGKYRDVEVAQLTGYSPNRIAILKRDPAFIELISHYRGIQETAYVDTVTKMKVVTDDALDILHDRLAEEPEDFTTPQLIEVVKSVGDRAGFSPVSKSIEVSATMSAERIQELKSSVRSRAQGTTKQITQEPINAEYVLSDELASNKVASKQVYPKEVNSSTSESSEPNIGRTLQSSGNLSKSSQAERGTSSRYCVRAESWEESKAKDKL